MSPGEYARLRATVTVIGGGTVAGYQWSGTGPILKDYEDRTRNLEVWSTQPMLPSDYRQQTIAFYWKPQNPTLPPVRAVKVVVRMSDNSTCTATRNITVAYDPTKIDRQAEDFYTANHPVGSRGRVLHEHMKWHSDYQLANGPPNNGLPVYDGTLFFDFHRKFIGRFNRWRAEFGYYDPITWDPRVPAWDPGTAIPTGPKIDHLARKSAYTPQPILSWFTSAGGAAARPSNNAPCDTAAGQTALTGATGFVSRALLGCAATQPWHDKVHVTVGGDMQDPTRAPKDPLFWRWHTYLDRVSQAWLGISTCCAPDTVAPEVIDQEPFRLFNFITELPKIGVLFHEAVTGVQAADLTINGVAATRVGGSGAGPYWFSGFAAPRGPLTVRIAAGAIKDIAGNRFAGTAWTYTLVDAAADADGDGVNDGLEANTYLSNPTTPDTDGDSLPDGYEIAHTCLYVLANGDMSMDMDPTHQHAMPPQDTDGDGQTDLAEFQRGTDPCVAAGKPGLAGNLLGATTPSDGPPAANLFAALALVLGLACAIHWRQRVARRTWVYAAAALLFLAALAGPHRVADAASGPAPAAPLQGTPTVTPTVTNTAILTATFTSTPAPPTVTNTAILTATRTSTPALPSITPPSTPTPTALAPTCTPGPGNQTYSITTGTATIVPGTTDIGNHCDDCTTTIALPFPFTLYDQTFTSVTLDANGVAMFPEGPAALTDVCLPAVDYTYAIFPYWKDLVTDCPNCGIFTAVQGKAPNRSFVIEWRAAYYSGGGAANFELLLYEGASRFETRFGGLTYGTGAAISGVQRDPGNFTQYFCDSVGGRASGSQTYILPPACSTPVPSATPTRTPTSSATPTVSCTPLPARTILAGVDDNFAPGNPEPAAPSQAQILYAQQRNLSLAGFDGTAANRAFMHTFTVDLSAGPICNATLQMRLRSNCDSSRNDSLNIGSLTPGNYWGSYLGTGYSPNPVLQYPWSCRTNALITLDLASLPVANYGTALNMLNATNGSLPIYIQDDTAVDFMRLTVQTCPCPTATPTATPTPPRGSISGIIYAQSITSTQVISGAYVFACRDGGPCTTNTVRTGADGRYTLDGLVAGQYEVHAFPATGSSLRPGRIGPLALLPGRILANQHIIQPTVALPPPGTVLDPVVNPGPPGAGGVPSISYVEWIHLETLPVCSPADQGDWVEYAIVAQDGTVLSTSPLDYNSTTGKWETEIEPLAPIIAYYGGKYLNVHAEIVITHHCVNGGDTTIEFDIYIDPSGYVRTVSGTPIPDATVTLYRADSPEGPFTIVPNGSGIMAPDNRRNPDRTDADGHFGWNVIAGYYVVRAEHPGCVDPDNATRPYVDSYVMTIPPPVTDLDLRLSCDGGTPTPCPVTFSDVPSTNPFYPFIRCLACRGILSGYADGTFRWGNNLTRGQVSKIVANAAAFTEAIASTQQSFADVPNSSPFWVFIERLSSRGHISGYTCGAPGEPCDPANRPYFRANADVTRGQLSKIAASAAEMADPVPTTQQTFTDVPPGNVFWLFVERLAGRGVISGYGCGGPGEPCDAQNRPYFRWGSNATRGQMAKVAANIFYPNCVTPAGQ